MTGGKLPRRHITVKTAFDFSRLVRIKLKLQRRFPAYEIIVVGWGGEKVWTDDWVNSATLLPEVRAVVDGVGTAS